MDTKHGQTINGVETPYFGYLPDKKGGVNFNPEMVDYAHELMMADGLTKEQAQEQAQAEFIAEGW